MRITVKVIPNARREEVILEENDLKEGRIKVKVMAPPEDGRANVAVLKLLAKHFGVKKNAVSLISGEKSREKIVEIKGKDA